MLEVNITDIYEAGYGCKTAPAELEEMLTYLSCPTANSQLFLIKPLRINVLTSAKKRNGLNTNIPESLLKQANPHH